MTCHLNTVDGDLLTTLSRTSMLTDVIHSWICVDESISRWYGVGGDWINAGLPMYAEIDRKPENGCEIQDAACGKFGIMIRIKLVKTKEEDEAQSNREDALGVLHGTKVLLDLVSAWANTGGLVCGDSYFAAVGAAIEQQLKWRELDFASLVSPRQQQRSSQMRTYKAWNFRAGARERDWSQGTRMAVPIYERFNLHLV